MVDRAVGTQLSASIETMSRVLVDQATVDAVLQLVLALALSSIDKVDEASVSLVRGQSLESSATSERVRDLDDAQYRTGEGPCVSAIREAEHWNVRLGDEADRWPTWVPAATALGVRSVLAMPLSRGDNTIGAVNLYSAVDSTFCDADVAAAGVFADHASVVLSNTATYAASEANAQHLQTALETARIIGRAQGVLMAREGCSSEAAFDVLRRASQRANRKLREIAEELVESLEHGARSRAASGG